MKYEVKREVVNQAELTITVDVETVAKAVNKGYLKIAKSVDIPGFRKGKVPKFVLEQKIGQGAILEEAAEIMMGPAYAQAISEEGLNPVARPEVEIIEIGEDKEFVFKATVTLQPEPEISEYKGLKLTKKAVEVTEEDIEAHIERMRDRHAKMVTVEEGVVEEDDIAYIDYVGSVDGVEFPGGKGENYPLGIGSDTFIPGFEEQLKGVAVGGDVDVNVTFPEDYHAEDLKGKAALFKVHVNKINRKELAELTDDFVKLISPVETVEEYRTHVAEELKEQAERSAEEDLKNQAIEALLANTEVVIPEVMIEDKIDDFMSDISARLSQQGLNLEQYLQYIGKTVAEIREEQKPSAEKSVKTEVTLLEVAKKENIEATDVDIDAEIAKVALMTNSKPEDIKGRLMESGQFNVLVFSIMLKKSIEFLVANAEIVTE
ncbi:MAG: trigger factor [Firmicutes bacterium]|nr:trigger factor [Bacillota bacterium]